MSATVGATATWLEEPVECGPRAGFGVYLHVPFCAHRCGYCDFATYDDRGHLQDRYVAALRDLIARTADGTAPPPAVDGGWPTVTSIYVGGGTPTVLPGAELAAGGGSTVLAPQCGLAPGLIGIVGGWLAAEFETVHTMELRVGALPRNPSGLLGYNFNWSPEGVINEYLNGCEVLRDGERRIVPAMSEVERIVVGGIEFEGALTSGGLGTANLPYTIYQIFYNAHDFGRASAAGVVVVIGTIIIATFALRTVSSLFREEGAR
jgi:saccharopine dehydrogenase-like NADP-dependent oxidoreductase